MPREKLVKLIQVITGRKNDYTPADPEYYTLDGIVSDEMAEVGACMKRRTYQSPEEIAKKCGKSLEETTKQLLALEKVGVLESRTVDGKDEFFLPIFVPGIYELLVLNSKQVKEHPETARGFEEYLRLRIPPLAPNMPMGNGAMRVIPVDTAIDGQTRKASYEELEYWLNKYEGHLGVGPCQCRIAQAIRGEGTGDKPEDLCIIVGDTAESCIRTDKIRRITKDEAWHILRESEKKGYVHQVTNMDGPDKIFAICNCNVQTCYALRTSQLYNTPNFSRSNYVAKVDKEKCVACGQCVEKCPANAVKMGQKLCTITPLKTKKTILPDDHKWSEANYNPDYKNNRELVLPTGTAPCKTACPAHIAVQGYIKLAAQGKYTEALDLIKKENPFPAVCGRICPHNCESQCTRGDIDQPIAIDEIKKFIADRELKAENRFIPEKLNDFSDYKVAIVGAGPAGLSCAYYLALDNFDVTVFEKQEKLGGMLTLGIPSFRLEKDVVEAEIDVLRQLGVKFRTGCEVGKDVTLDELRDQGFGGFYLAIGAQAGRKLGIDGEDAQGVIAGVDFLRNVNIGKDTKVPGKVVVIGGGNVAIDVARTAVRQGGDTVEMFCLESAAEMPALPEEIEEAVSEGIKINNGWGPKRIVVENGKVTAVEFKKCVSVFKDGKFAPEYDEESCISVPTDHVLLSVGQSIDWGKLIEGSRVELGRGSTAVADSFTYQTAQPDVFVGGDVYSGPKFAIDAIAAGKQGAESIHRYVMQGHSLTIARDRREYVALDKENVNKQALITGFDNTPRQRPVHKAENEKTFRDTRMTFTEEQLKKETARCLGCGASIVDENRCIGCGVCTTRCKFDAIRLERVFDKQSIPYEKVPIQVAKRMVTRQKNILVRKIKGEKDD